MNLVKNGTFLYGMEHWGADHIAGAEALYEPGMGSPSPGCANLPVDDRLWQKIERLDKGRFEIRFRAKGVSDDQEFVAIEVQILDNVFQTEHSTKLPFGIGGVNLRRWVDYSAIVELPDIAPAYLVFEIIEADGSLYVDSIEMEPLPEELCPGLVHEVQKRRRDPNTTKHPEERYKEVVTQAVNGSPSSLWQTDYIDIETKSDQHWYQLESAVQKPEYVKRVLVHRIVGTDTEEEVIGRWTTEFGQDGYVYLQLDEPTYDGCILRVEYAQYPDFPACGYAITLPIDREWMLCRATTLLLMEADPTLEPPELIERDLQYWDAKRVAREAEVVPRPRTARARTLRSEAYAEKALPCGDIEDIVGGPTSVPAEPTVTPDPIADFHADETESSYIPFAVQFRDDSEGSIIKWTWNFGDGTGSNEEEPLHSYAEGGFYSIVLDVMDADGRRATKTRNDYINVGIPTADFEAAPLAGTDPWPVEFTDLSAGIIESWSWDFGDTETSTEQNPTHDYAASGDRTVVLLVTGPTGTSTSESQILPVGDPGWMPPTAKFRATNRETSDLPVDVQFTYIGRRATTWAWTFGDGGESDEENPKHTYTTAEKFTVGLTVTNAFGEDLETRVDFIITGIPIAFFKTLTPVGLAPHLVTFRNNSKGTITKHSWAFGDEKYWSNKEEPTHGYKDPGVYTVELRVTGPTGAHTRERPDYIVVNKPETPSPQASFWADPTEGDSVPLDVTFTDTSTGDLVKWWWNFGDGGTSREQNPVHQYTVGGVFDVSLKVTDTEDRTNTVTIEGLITIGRITADFAGGPRTGEPRTVGFENLTVGIVDTWLWDFGDGETSNEFEPEHDYGPGDTPPTDYTVKLTATGPVNTHSEEKVDYITVDDYPAPVADFEPDTKVLPLQGECTVEFVNKSTDAEAYLWDFDYLANPGVDTSTEKDPIWTFENDSATEDKDFTVRLTVSGPGGSDDWHEEIYTLPHWEPASAYFDAVPPRLGPKPLTIQFLNTSVYSTSWLWDFDWIGNPGVHTSTDRHATHTYTEDGWYTVKLTAYPPGEGDSDDHIETDFIHVGTPDPERVTDGLQAEYHFNEGSGGAVKDVSEVGSSLDLTILTPANTTWGDGGYLTVDDSVVIESNDVAAKIIDACKVSNELTLEAWVTRGATVKDGLEHWVVGLMSVETPWWRNCGMGEIPDDDKMASRIRTAGTGNLGGPAESDSGALLDAELIHMVVTRASGGATKLYQNGVEIKEVAGDVEAFSSWGETFKLILVNHHNGNNPWLGSLHLVAVYSKALSLTEVEQNYNFGGETPVSKPPPPVNGPEPTHWVSSGVPVGWDIPTGNNDGDGSETDPWETLEHAVGQLVPGMVLGVQGNFNERLDLNWMYRNGQEGNRIYIVGVNANGHKAEVDGQYSLPAGGSSAVDCPTGDLDHTYSPLVRVGIEDGGGKGDYTTIQNLVIMQSRGRGINIEFTDGFHLIDVDIKETRAGSFRINAGNNNVIRNVTTYHSSNYCTQQRAANGAPWPHSLIAQYETNVQFENCVATESYGEGMGMHNCTDSAFVNCASFDSNNTGISMNAGVNSKIVNCFVAYRESLKPSCGITVAGEGGDTVGGYTGMKRDTDGVLVANNIVYGASPGIRIRNQSLDYGMFNISLYHNTVIQERPPKLHPEKWLGGTSFLIRRPSNDRGYKAVDIRNNLCVGVDANEDIAKSQMVFIASMDSKWLDAITFSHNWWSHRPDEAKGISPQDKIGGPSVAKTSLDSPQVPEDAEVKSGCTARGAGRDLRNALRKVVDDYWGTTRPAAPTMGAHEPTDE